MKLFGEEYHQNIREVLLSHNQNSAIFLDVQNFQFKTNLNGINISTNGYIAILKDSYKNLPPAPIFGGLHQTWSKVHPYDQR